MGINEFVEKYRISLGNRGNLVAHDVPKKKQEEVLAFAQSHYEEIKRAISEKPHQQKVITEMQEGLDVIKKATASRDSKMATLSIMKATGIDVKDEAIQKLENEFNKKVSKYPKEYAYIRAKRMSESGNKWRKLAGERAVRKILDGENSEEAIRKMEQEWREDIQKDIQPNDCIKSDVPYTIMGRSEHGARTSTWHMSV